MPHETAVKASFWWKDIMTYSDHYRGIAQCKIGDGKTIMLWSDVRNGHYLQQELPRLYSYAKNIKISVEKYLSNQAIEENFHLPLSISRIASPQCHRSTDAESNKPADKR